MVEKRPFPGEGGDELNVLLHRPRRKVSFRSVVRDVMREALLNDIKSGLEPFLRRVVREEVEKLISCLLHSSPRPSLDQGERSAGRRLQLHFDCNLRSSIFTGSKIESQNGAPLKVVLWDADFGSIVRSSPLSSSKVEILALNGDFGSDDKECWTEREFNEHIVLAREGRRPLVTGDLTITLKDGVGYFHNIVFTDNSSWMRSRKFRLGARVSGEIFGRERVKEALSEAFVVKDQRVEQNQKHYPPYLSLNDDVWRLEKIARDGQYQKRLAGHGIYTVKDFLQSYARDPLSLRYIIGGDSGALSDRTWDKIIRHATTCSVDNDKLFVYCAQGVQLFFNCIYRVIGAKFDGLNYLPPKKFTSSQKHLVDKLRRQAFRNLNDLLPVDDATSVSLSCFLTNQDLDITIASSINLCQPSLQVAPRDGPSTQVFDHPSTLNHYTYQAEDNQIIGSSAAQSFHPMQEFSPALRNSFRMSGVLAPCDMGNTWFPSCSQGPVLLGEQYPIVEDIPQVQMPAWSLPWCQGNGFSFSACNEVEDKYCLSSPIHIAANGKPRIGWCKIWAALKLGVSVRKDVAAKRMALQLLCGET